MNQNIKDKFNFFRNQPYIYLDSAATTQVPGTVINAVVDVLQYKGNPHRSSHKIAKRNEKLLVEARANIANFIGATSDEIVFTTNTTDSLNLAITAIADKFSEGDEILIAVSEHNSNVLPYLRLTKQGVKIRLIDLDEGEIDIKDIKAKLNKNTKLVAIGHCANVLGNINPVTEIGKLIFEYNPDIYYFIDGAQAVAHIPINVIDYKCSFYAFSGHKMYGPDGVGVLFINKKIHSDIKPVRVGGGTISQLAITRNSDQDILYPGYYPTLQVLEGGSPNTSNIIGLSKAVSFLKSIGINEIRKHELELTDKLIVELSKFSGVELIGPKDLNKKIGVVSFSLSESDISKLGDYLSSNNICVRYGAHCAFLLLDKLQKETLRISLGAYNDSEDIERCITAIKSYFQDNKTLQVSSPMSSLKSTPFSFITSDVKNIDDIHNLIQKSILDTENTNIVIMGGHFLGIPDAKQNTFYPGIKPLLSENLRSLLDDYGMTEFPLVTWKLGCKLTSQLKLKGVKTKLVIVANDTTGINELCLSSSNTTNKIVKDYRDELICEFINSLPTDYLKILNENNLSLDDLIRYNNKMVFQESILRGHFKNFVRRNKSILKGSVEYSADGDNINLMFNILNNPDIKTCSVGTFGSKTGGKYCIATVGEFIAELFGIFDNSPYTYIPDIIKNPIVTKTNNILVMFSPAMCNNAVNSSAELYIKLFSQGKREQKFTFINIPLGPDPLKNLEFGVKAYITSD